MSHAAIHFVVGLLAGLAASVPALWSALRRGERLAGPLSRWLVGSYALGLWAIVPSLLRHTGLPPAFCDGWWMNLFLCHPLIRHLRPGGTIIAAAALLAIVGLQYTLLLLALVRARRRAADCER